MFSLYNGELFWYLDKEAGSMLGKDEITFHNMRYYLNFFYI